MNYLVTALVSFLVAFGAGALLNDVIFPRDTVTRVMESDLDNCYADLDACDALRSGMECK